MVDGEWNCSRTALVQAVLKLRDISPGNSWLVGWLVASELTFPQDVIANPRHTSDHEENICHSNQ
jgi:hypothetical protein